jgi:hypothetical protein
MRDSVHDVHVLRPLAYARPTTLLARNIILLIDIAYDTKFLHLFVHR